MTFALTLLVLLSPGDEGMAASLAAAARETLGAGASLELRVVLPPPDDAAAGELAAQAGAGALALIAWSDAQHARVRVYSTARARWLERDLTFAAADPMEEKGRTIGFTVASMLPEAQAPSAPSAPPPVVASVPPAPATPSAPRVAPARPAVAAVSPPWTFAVDAAVQAALAIDGEGTSAGGELAGRYRLGEHLALRAFAALRVGHVEALEATLLSVDLGPSLTWISRDVVPAHPWAFGLRVDAFARLQSVRRPATDADPAESHGRFVPGVGLQLETSYAMSADIALLAAAGAHALLGETEVLRDSQQVASFAPVELVAGLGAIARF
jgi:hypothetical protein